VIALMNREGFYWEKLVEIDILVREYNKIPFVSYEV